MRFVVRVDKLDDTWTALRSGRWPSVIRVIQSDFSGSPPWPTSSSTSPWTCSIHCSTPRPGAESVDLIVRHARLRGRPDPVDIGIAEGRVGSAAPGPATRAKVIPKLEVAPSRDRGQLAVVRDECGAPGPKRGGELDGVGSLHGDCRPRRCAAARKRGRSRSTRRRPRLPERSAS